MHGSAMVDNDNLLSGGQDAWCTLHGAGEGGDACSGIDAAERQR